MTTMTMVYAGFGEGRKLRCSLHVAGWTLNHATDELALDVSLTVVRSLGHRGDRVMTVMHKAEPEPEA